MVVSLHDSLHHYHLFWGGTTKVYETNSSKEAHYAHAHYRDGKTIVSNKTVCGLMVGLPANNEMNLCQICKWFDWEVDS